MKRPWNPAKAGITGMQRSFLRRARDDRGQAMVEFALVMPILLLVVIGIFEFGRAWNTQQALTDAAREGARAAAIYNLAVGADSVEKVVETALGVINLDPAEADIFLSGETDPDADSGTAVTVRVEYPYEFVFLGQLLNWATGKSNLTLATQVTMRNE